MAIETRGRKPGPHDQTTFAYRLGQRIREVRRGRCLTLQEVAQRTNGAVDPVTLSNIELGKAEPKLSRLLLIASVLHCKLSDLTPVETKTS